MGRKCSLVGCHSSIGLHRFPQDSELKRKWLRVVGLGENGDVSPRAGVCMQHFARDDFVNFREFELGFAKRLILKSEAVPTIALPRRLTQRPPTLMPRKEGHVEIPIQPKPTREIGSQTDKVLTMHEFVQANVMPSRRSKAIQARAPHRSAYSDTDDLMENPHPEMFKTPALCLKTESNPTEVPLLKENEHIVDEDQLLSLFQRCPVCSGRCVVNTMTTGALLQVTQKCPRCEFCFQWSSQSMTDGIATGNGQHCDSASFDSLFDKVPKDEQIEVQLSDPEAPRHSDDDSDAPEEEKVAVKRKRSEVDNDEDWLPQSVTKELSEQKQNSSSSEEEEDSDGNQELSDNDLSSSDNLFLNLCSECGLFHWPHLHHTCIHKVKPHACSLCGRRYVTEESLKRHRSRSHSVKKKWTRNENWREPL